MVAFAGCEGPPAAASLTEWTADDHHSTDDGKLTGRAPAQPSAAGGARRDDAANVAQLVDLTWRQQCTSCHGEAGKGDGRMGPMLRRLTSHARNGKGVSVTLNSPRR